MIGIVWYLIAGVLLVGMALGGTLLKRLPLTTSMFYLLVGVGLGPLGLGLLDIDALRSSAVLERLTEIAVIVSLFTAGLKLRAPWSDRHWLPPVRLASISMIITVALVAAIGVTGLDLSLGAAVLLGAILAPTDPVLASDVQVEHPADTDRLRFTLTGEAALNDGTAFPFVMLGLGLLGTHDIGRMGWRWLAVDVAWAVAAGLAVGAVLGTLLGRLLVYLRRAYQQAVGLDDFFALGLIALVYGAALLAHAYGFLAVVAAGLALRRIERLESGDAGGPPVVPDVSDADEEAATHAETATAYMAQAVLSFNEKLERIAEVGVVVVIGAMLSAGGVPAGGALWFVPVLFLLVRPLAVVIGLRGARASRLQRSMFSWFGIRGVGSLYYLMYAIQQGIGDDIARRLTSLALTVVAASIVVHGVSVTPLMQLYRRRTEGRRGRVAR